MFFNLFSLPFSPSANFWLQEYEGHGGIQLGHQMDSDDKSTQEDAIYVLWIIIMSKQKILQTKIKMSEQKNNILSTTIFAGLASKNEWARLQKY